jgi:hypothetical protein
MRLGAIICPNCTQVKGVDLSKQTTRCIRCGKTLHLKKLTIFYATESQEQLRHAIGLLNAEIQKKHGTFSKKVSDNYESK